MSPPNREDKPRRISSEASAYMPDLSAHIDGTNTKPPRRQRANPREQADETVPPADPLAFDYKRTLVRMADVDPLRVEWLWKDRIPLGMLSLLDGDPGLGKSTAMIDIAARVSTGNPMPFESSRREPAAVFLASAEDHLAATMRPRLDAHGADSRRVFAINPDWGMVLTPQEIAQLEAEVTAQKALLVVIDPLMAYLDGRVDSSKDQDVRRVLRLLSSMAERTGAAVVIVRHLRKEGGDALYRGGGSIGIIGAARAAMFAAKDPDDPDMRLLAMSKSNLSKLAPALRWRMVDQHGVGRVEWLGVAEGVTADQLAAVSENTKDKDDEQTLVDGAKDAIRELLADGMKLSNEVMADVKAMTGASLRTIEMAREQMRKAGELRAVKIGKPWALELVKAAKDPTDRLRPCGLDQKAESTHRDHSGMNNATGRTQPAVIPEDDEP